MILKLTYSESYTLAFALDDAIATQQRAADVFRNGDAFTPAQREQLARSCEDRAAELRGIRKRVDA
jgi:hypothetical protein